MAKSGHDLGLAPKALQLLPVLGKTRVEQLHRNAAPKTLLNGFVHRSHPATAERRLDEAIAAAEDDGRAHAPLNR
jgi:hypothetical protein